MSSVKEFLYTNGFVLESERQPDKFETANHDLYLKKLEELKALLKGMSHVFLDPDSALIGLENIVATSSEIHLMRHIIFSQLSAQMNKFRGFDFVADGLEDVQKIHKSIQDQTKEIHARVSFIQKEDVHDLDFSEEFLIITEPVINVVNGYIQYFVRQDNIKYLVNHGFDPVRGTFIPSACSILSDDDFYLERRIIEIESCHFNLSEYS